MRNLLTESFKRTLRQEYILRLGSVVAWLVASAFGIGILASMPSFILATSTHRTLEDQHRLLQARLSGGGQVESGAPIELLGKRLEVLARAKDRERLTEALLSVLNHRSDSITLRSMGYTKAGGKTELALKGTALNRDALLSFKRALEEDGRFESVGLPVSNLAREKDILFDITLSGKF